MSWFGKATNDNKEIEAISSLISTLQTTIGNFKLNLDQFEHYLNDYTPAEMNKEVLALNRERMQISMALKGLLSSLAALSHSDKPRAKTFAKLHNSLQRMKVVPDIASGGDKKRLLANFERVHDVLDENSKLLGSAYFTLMHPHEEKDSAQKLREAA